MSAFVARSQPLYGVTATTFKVHQLLHLANSCIQNLGPLWTDSTFVFEVGNSKLLKSVTAARGLPHQIMERMAVGQQLDNFTATGGISEEEKDCCTKFLGHPGFADAAQDSRATLLGRSKHTTFAASEKRALDQMGCYVTRIECYERIIYNNQVYHSVVYTKLMKSDSTFVQTSHGYFQIQKVIQAPFEAADVVVSCCAEFFF